MNDFDSVILAVACVALVLITCFLLIVMFLSNIARILGRISPENRRMEPAQVWLNLIPVFNIVWTSITVDRVAESLHNEYVSRGLDQAHDSYGRTIGLTLLILMASGFLFLLVSDTEAIGVAVVLIALLAFFCWVGYWLQVNRYAEGLKAGAYRPPPIDEEW